jgi:DNA-binding GntR family transcriptional regulator
VLRQFRVPQRGPHGVHPGAAAVPASHERGAILARQNAQPNLNVLVPDGLRGRRTIQEIVAQALREAIITGRLRGGSRLHQDGIASQLGVSRMPVREALRQLESEGLVVFTPHRRVSVAELSRDELREIYEIRAALEVLALGLAVPRLSSRDFTRLGALLDQMDRVSDPGRWLDLNRAFHGNLYRASGRPRLCTLIESLRGNVERYLRMYVSGVEHRTRAQAEHRCIVRACRRRHVSEAKQALRQHLVATASILENFLEAPPPKPDAGADG